MYESLVQLVQLFVESYISLCPDSFFWEADVSDVPTQGKGSYVWDKNLVVLM